LLHISELEQEKAGGENIKLNSGDEVKVKILNVDPKGRRIKLGLPVEKSSKVSGEFKQYIDNGSSGISIGDMIDLDKNKE
nr:S1 RNA-binding domain-containing protein [bacterium]